MLTTTISWSGGKDSAFALYKILCDLRYNVVGLHTVIDADTRRVGLHGVREEVIEFQAKSLGLPLTKLYTSADSGGSNYENVMRSFYENCDSDGVDGVVFGDIFLEDLRAYRERLLDGLKITPLFPLWKIDSQKIYSDFVGVGFKAAICSANAALFSEQQLGITLESATPRAFTKGTDVCGENGEYHTLVYDGPIFKMPLLLRRGDVVKKWYDYRTKTIAGEIEMMKIPFLFQEFFLLNAS